MAVQEQFTADGYPEDVSEIMTDPMGFGHMDAFFTYAIKDFGNDEAVIWPSYTDDGVTFKVRYDGEGTSVQEGKTWPIWLLEFTGGGKDKILKVDIATCSSERWTPEGFVPGSYLDNSDLIAAAINLKRFTDERLDEGDSFRAVRRRAIKQAMDDIANIPTTE